MNTIILVVTLVLTGGTATMSGDVVDMNSCHKAGSELLQIAKDVDGYVSASYECRKAI